MNRYPGQLPGPSRTRRAQTLASCRATRGGPGLATRPPEGAIPAVPLVMSGMPVSLYPLVPPASLARVIAFSHLRAALLTCSRRGSDHQVLGNLESIPYAHMEGPLLSRVMLNEGWVCPQTVATRACVWSLSLHNFSDLERGTHLARSSGHFCHLRGFFFPLLLETLLLGRAAPWPPVWRFPNAGLRFWNILRCLPALVPVKSHPWDLLSTSS